MAKLSAVASDPTLEAEGVWVQWVEGIELLVGRMFNAAFDEEVARLQEAAIAKYGADIPKEAREDIRVKATARTVLKGWRNVQKDDGSDWAYTSEAGEKVLADPAYRDLYVFVSHVSNQANRYRVEAHEKASGN